MSVYFLRMSETCTCWILNNLQSDVDVGGIRNNNLPLQRSEMKNT